MHLWKGREGNFKDGAWIQSPVMEFQEDWEVKTESKLCKHLHPLGDPYLGSLGSQHAHGYLVENSSYGSMNPICAPSLAACFIWIFQPPLTHLNHL